MPHSSRDASSKHRARDADHVSSSSTSRMAPTDDVDAILPVAAPAVSSNDSSRRSSAHRKLHHGSASTTAKPDKEERDRKKSSGLKSFLTLKEPSLSAFEQYAQQQRKLANMPGVSSAKLPTKVPKVNSRWDGLPEAARRKTESDKAAVTATSKRHSISLMPKGPRRSSASTSTASSSGSRTAAPSVTMANWASSPIAPWSEPPEQATPQIVPFADPQWHPSSSTLNSSVSIPRSPHHRQTELPTDVPDLPEMTCFFPDANGNLHNAPPNILETDESGDYAPYQTPLSTLSSAKSQASGSPSRKQGTKTSSSTTSSTSRSSLFGFRKKSSKESGSSSKRHSHGSSRNASVPVQSPRSAPSDVRRATDAVVTLPQTVLEGEASDSDSSSSSSDEDSDDDNSAVASGQRSVSTRMSGTPSDIESRLNRMSVDTSMTSITQDSRNTAPTSSRSLRMRAATANSGTYPAVYSPGYSTTSSITSPITSPRSVATSSYTYSAQSPMIRTTHNGAPSPITMAPRYQNPAIAPWETMELPTYLTNGSNNTSGRATPDNGKKKPWSRLMAGK